MDVLRKQVHTLNRLTTHCRGNKQGHANVIILRSLSPCLLQRDGEGSEDWKEGEWSEDWERGGVRIGRERGRGVRGKGERGGE